MSLIGSLNVSKTALAAHQAALQVTSNNVANAGNPEYTRQVARLSPKPDRAITPGISVGTGIDLVSVERQIDAWLEERIRGSISDGEAAGTRENWLGRVEAIFHELGDNDLSSQFSRFFAAWSNLANKPHDIALRQVVLQHGQSLADTFQGLRSQFDTLLSDLRQRLNGLADAADEMTSQIAQLNERIVTAEGSGGMANGLRDQRDAVLKRLAELMDIKTVENQTGAVNVFVGSDPLVLGNTSRGVSIRETPSGETLEVDLVVRADNGALSPTAGQIGALLSLRQQVGSIVDQLDSLAGNLIFELNKLHAAGQGLEGFSQVTGTYAVSDPDAALNSDAAALQFKPVNGSFVIHVREKATGRINSTLIQVDLDGLNGDDTTLEGLRAAIDGVSGVSASIVGGKLRIESDSQASDITFSQDTSGVLAALGINTFFTGSGSLDIALNEQVVARPTLLAAAQNGQPADNQTALAIAALETQPVEALGGISLRDTYEQMISGVAVLASGARTNAEAAAAVLDTLTTQRESLSGVSLDEEAINLIREQRAFQASARVVAVVDEMMRTLLHLI